MATSGESVGESGRLVIISNRLPFTAVVKDGALQLRESPGGLTTGLWSYLRPGPESGRRSVDFTWVGWPGGDVPEELRGELMGRAAKEYGSRPVFMAQERVERFYDGFCNRTLWPLFHYFPYLMRCHEAQWLEYRRVNELYCEEVVRVVQPGDLVWVHDYQLLLLPRMLRERMPELAIGFFLHIPFPSFEVFRLLPGRWRQELVEGMLGASLVGFHTHDYTRHFLSCVLRTVGVDHQLGSLLLRDRLVKVDTFPMGIDYERYVRSAGSPGVEAAQVALRSKCGTMKVIFSVDRLDYTKGLLHRLRGYEVFLRQNPQWHGKVVFVLSVAPSRVGVESYQTMRKEIEQAVGRIVGAFGTVEWNPLSYQYRALGFEEVVAMYRMCDVALITPLRDGMNLVAKEYVAARPDQTGVLILSEMAGAAKEMGEALIVNPNDEHEVAAALLQALTMETAEQIRRNRVMQERLRRYDVNRWAQDFLQGLAAAGNESAEQRARSLTGRARTVLLQQFHGAAQRCFMLDYDGTLVPFTGEPSQARPDEELLGLLEDLAANPCHSVVIISGRPKVELEAWIGMLPIGLVAEHGIWLRPAGGEWRMLRDCGAGWKQQIRPILQVYVDRLPGSMLEEKDFSLAWHYRRADPEQASLRVRELLDDLADYTRNIDVQVLEGDKVLEVRHSGVNKGVAAREWLQSRPADWILAVGDDWTDEDLFRALPATAFTVRVGLAQTAARYHLGGHTAVRRLLREMAGGRGGSAPAGK